MERYSPGDTGRAMTLYNLADSLDDRLVGIDDIANLDQAVTLHRSVLDLHSAGRLDCHKSLFFLALWPRYHKQAAMPDLQEGGTLDRAALDLRHPAGHTDRSYFMISRFP